MNASSQPTSAAGGAETAVDAGVKLSVDLQGDDSGASTPTHGKLDVGAATTPTGDAATGLEDPDDVDMTTDVFESVDVVVHDGAVPIHASLTCLSEKARYVRVVYTCFDDGCDAMATEWEEIAADTSHEIQLYRMRAFTEYTIDLMYSESMGEVENDEVVAATRHISTGSTGVDALDAAPYAQFSGELGFQTYLTERSGHGFYGFIGLDRAGYGGLWNTDQRHRRHACRRSFYKCTPPALLNRLLPTRPYSPLLPASSSSTWMSVVWALNISAANYESVIGDLPSHAIAQFPDDYSFAVLCQGKQQLTRYDAAGKQVRGAVLLS